MPRAPSRGVESPARERRATRRSRDASAKTVKQQKTPPARPGKNSPGVAAPGRSKRARAHWYDVMMMSNAPDGMTGDASAEGSIRRGPHASASEATSELRALALAEGRGIRQCKRTTQGKRIVWLCRDAADAGAVVDEDAGGRCGYRAVVRRRTGTRGDADGSWWIAEYAPHDASCRSTPRLMSTAIACDPVIAEAVRVNNLRGRRLRELVKETFGVDVSARTSQRVRHRAKDVVDASSDRV